MAKKKFDPKAKARRQKVIAAVGGVLLLGVLAIQVPRTMKLMSSQSQSSSSSSSSSVSSSTTPSGTQPLAPPSLDGSATASIDGVSAPLATSTTPEGVSDPTSPLPPSAGQLISFSRFKSKDPFKQQIATACGSETTSSDGSSCATSSSGSSKPKTAAAGVTPSIAPKAPAQAPAAFAKPTEAVFSVNGVESKVAVTKSFPAAAPVFTLVSLTRSAAKIGIAGGSYENGAATVSVTKGKPVMLMNTADGTRYVVRLIATA